MGTLSGDIEIGLILSRSALGHQSGGKRGAAWAVYLIEPDLWIGLVEQADGRPGIIDDVYSDLAFRLSCLERFLPFNLPAWLGLGGSPGSAHNEEKQSDGQAKKESSFHTLTNHCCLRR